MPDFFEFKADSAYVRERLTQGEIGGVRTWQSNRLDYQFSFHTQHEAGWPVYLSEPTGPGRNLPKINVKVPTNPVQVLQRTSVRSPHVENDFYDVIVANMALFQKLARLYYEGQETVNNRQPTWAMVFKCKTSVQAKPVGVKLPENAQVIGEAFWANFKGRAKTPPCPLHKKTDCMVGELKQVPVNETASLKKRYDLNGDVQDEG